LNVFNNVAFGLRNLGILQAEVQGRVRSALQLVQLAGLDDRFPHELSGGQQQRVALARALVMRPSVLLLDEPFGALDQQLRKQMQVELKDLQRKLGLTFVFVTHDQEEALSLSDRVVLLHQGLLQQVGSPEEIYQHPKTRFAAEFMGVENIVEVKAFRPDGSTVRCRLASGDEVVIRKADESPPGQCFLAVRSSEVSISRSFPAPGERNVVRGRIRHQNYLGGAILWTVEAAPNEDWMASQLVSRDSGPIEKFSIGEEVFLSWDSRSGLLVS
jgi:spermidine/putrescine transport system ATP-binding protein